MSSIKLNKLIIQDIGNHKLLIVVLMPSVKKKREEAFVED